MTGGVLCPRHIDLCCSFIFKFPQGPHQSRRVTFRLALIPILTFLASHVKIVSSRSTWA
ncbi:hypothetical protein M407DRAFT_147709 [Tulasnella calospora MUT 4182]|uniref:Uncharacterized protein n=1 Tax=Tulasnella calospora MUT 4182 TaxID=1051891 RepID=A0A0C3LA02_9AGAM|nr:hypothetical protein M407DRAFT_147709 [Tulasnella calospora MUT 4182]